VPDLVGGPTAESDNGKRGQDELDIHGGILGNGIVRAAKVPNLDYAF
jgi:hypothetical protein